MKVLLSPAKALDMSKKLNTQTPTVPIFLSEAETIMKKLSKVSAKKIGQLMHLSTDLADLNYDRNQLWQAVEELDENSAMAGAAFNGEVYRGLDATNFSEKQLKIAQEKVRILSGLYGLLKPTDVIYPYRLEMGTKWGVTPAKPTLYKFWGTKIADQLNEEVGDGVIVNLASTEYFKAVDKKKLKARVITPTFKDFKNGTYKVIMVFAKQSRGAMARFIVENDLNDPEELKGFNVDGYRFDANLSEGDEWVFTR